MICTCVGIGSTTASPGDVSLCTQHYHKVYKVLHATSRSYACKCCGVLARNSKHKNFALILKELNLFSGIPLHLVIALKIVIKYAICNE